MDQLSHKKLKEKKRQKGIGYFFRIIAVVIWGLEPLFVKYTPISEIEPDIRSFFWMAAIAFWMVISIILLSFFSYTKKMAFEKKIPLNRYFVMIVLGTLFLTYFMNVSLDFTAGTNYILLNNFAPVFALFIAFLFWKAEIPYFNNTKSASLIFATFLIGSIGSSFLFYNEFLYGTQEGVKGNFYAFIAMSMDTLVVVSQIRYAKHLKDNQSFLILFYVFSLCSLLLLPFVFDRLGSVSIDMLYWFLGIGLLSCAGYIASYEAFRRMDGFIAFLMFNVSILITFSVEAFLLNEIIITTFLVFGGVLIIGASILAEITNTRLEKPILKKMEEL